MDTLPLLLIPDKELFFFMNGGWGGGSVAFMPWHTFGDLKTTFGSWSSLLHISRIELWLPALYAKSFIHRGTSPAQNSFVTNCSQPLCSFSLLNFRLFSRLSIYLLLYQSSTLYPSTSLSLFRSIHPLTVSTHPPSPSCSQLSTHLSIHSSMYPSICPLSYLSVYHQATIHLSTQPLNPPITGVEHLCWAGHHVYAKDVVMCAVSPGSLGFPSSSQLLTQLTTPLFLKSRSLIPPLVYKSLPCSLITRPGDELNLCPEGKVPDGFSGSHFSTQP